jgi:hypothetical protein
MPTFSYQYGANPLIDVPRLMISDTQQYGPNGTQGNVFWDEEITMIETFVVPGQFQSAQFYSPPLGQNLPNTGGIPWLRIAAYLLDAMASNASKLAMITRILDVELSPDRAAKFLMAQAKSYRDTDDNAGAFFIIEQVNNDWSLISRYWKQVQRQQGIPFG